MEFLMMFRLIFWLPRNRNCQSEFYTSFFFLLFKTAIFRNSDARPNGHGRVCRFTAATECNGVAGTLGETVAEKRKLRYKDFTDIY
jgi:hypothetical protein